MKKIIEEISFRLAPYGQTDAHLKVYTFLAKNVSWSYDGVYLTFYKWEDTSFLGRIKRLFKKT